MPLDDILSPVALTALKPMSYVMRIGVVLVASGAVINVEKVIARVIGLVWRIITGVLLLLAGITHGTAVDTILGLVAPGAAAYS